MASVTKDRHFVNMHVQELAGDHAPAQPAMSLSRTATPTTKYPNPTMTRTTC